MRVARRVALLLGLLFVAFGLLAAWNAYHLRNDVRDAEQAATELEASLRADDVAGRNQAAKDLTDSAASAADRTDGFVWKAVEHAPVFGDDAAAVSAVSRSLDTLAAGAVQPLLLTVDSLDGVSSNGRIDIDKLESVVEPVKTAYGSARSAQDEVAELRPGNYTSAVARRVETYRNRLNDLVDGLRAGRTALRVVPGVLGADGPRDYLLVFQNNAEIRATGGIPGSWAQIHVTDGRLQIVKQGSSLDFVDGFDANGNPIVETLPISKEEEEVYSKLLGRFWQDANFTPDWPRAAELLTQRWEGRYAPVKLDGVISIDPVAMSYLLVGTAPVQVGGSQITAENVVEQLLSTPYRTLDGEQQDKFFADAAQALFTATTSNIAEPLDLVRGVDRAVRERRFLVTLFDPKAAESLDGSDVSGVVPRDDGDSPKVLVGLNDATASKMSYYLRYEASMESTGCSEGRQSLAGSLELSQTIPASEAAKLPGPVTGPGDIGIPRGSQLVVVRLYSPTGGGVGSVSVAGEDVDVDVMDLDGRQVVTVVAQLSGPEPVPVTWNMTSGPSQTAAGELRVTPGIEQGSKDSRFDTAC